MRPVTRNEKGIGDEPLRVGVVDTGVNPWHSHVRGPVQGCRVYRDAEGRIREDADFRDPVGHGTAVAGVIRQGLADAEIFAVRVFERGLTTHPSLVARGVLRAAAEGCAVVNLSLSTPAGPGSDTLVEACLAVQEAGCAIVAAGDPRRPGLLPASLAGVFGVVSDDWLAEDEIAAVPGGPYPYAAFGLPRDLEGLPREANLWGHSFACARFSVHVALEAVNRSHTTRKSWLDDLPLLAQGLPEPARSPG
jgi:subtilisin family serine protease